MTQTLKARLGQDRALLCPGVYDGFTAAMAAEAGFEALYLSGAAMAYTLLGKPDIGLLSLHEVADVMFRIRERVDLPVVCDGDTGWGNAINVQRTMRVLERAGASAVQLEDQGFPKRCGHLKGKSLIPTGEMVGKLRAALDARDKTLVIARTDAIAVEGFERALDRGEAYLEAGADVVFVEAPENREQMQGIVARFGGRVPLMANMIEGGRTPLLSVDELGTMGFRLVIFPGGVVRALAKTVQEYYAVLKANGTSASMMPRMFDFVGLNEVIGTERILAAGRAYETFEKKAAE
jgi:2-methylisocitrate lyase-like PEP mutase family enzyme